MKILIAGGKGLIGSALTPLLQQHGHQVTILSRHPNQNEIGWDPQNGSLNAYEIEGFDAIINLSGENVGGYWTASKKKKILESRIQTTHLLKESIKKLNHKPAVFINASAIGYYGNRGSEDLDEESAPGSGFLADVCRQWEKAAEGAGVRTVIPRFGVVLSPKGGALAKMLTPFKLGLGGPIGDGKQYMSWVSLEDVVQALYFTLTHPDAQGPINVVSPNPVTNEEFTKTLGKAVGRPTFFAVPQFIVKTLFGEMGEEMLLGSAYVEPKKLDSLGYTFAYPYLDYLMKMKF